MSRTRYRKLKPGPSQSAEEVADDQRARLCEAMIELVAERGYDGVTVLDVTQRAGVSKRVIYERFAGKEDCFLATYDLIQRRTAKRVMAGYWSGEDWRERLRLAFRAFAHETVRDPRAARLVHVESFAAGPAALERIQHAAALFAAMIKESFDHAPGDVVMPSPLLRGVVSGLAGVARTCLLKGCERELPDLVDELLEWTVGIHSEAAAELAELGAGSPVAPAGPEHRLAAPLVNGNNGTRAVDREMILSATAGLAAQEGYRQLSVPRIRAAAGVSRQSFDANFSGPQDCFLAALDLLTERTIALAEEESTVPGRNWAGGIHRTVVALCSHAVREPALARLAFVEVFAPGSLGIRHQDNLTAAIAERFRAGAPSTQRLSPIVADASIGAIWGVVHHYVVSDRVSRLAQIAPLLSLLVLAPALGAPGAAEAIRAEHARIDGETQATTSLSGKAPDGGSFTAESTGTRT